MLTKTFGMILIFLSSSTLGIYLANKIKFQISDLKQIINSLEILKSEINFGISQLADAMQNISSILIKTHGNIFAARLFKNLSIKLNNKTYSSARDAWLDILSSFKNKTYLDQEDILILNSFAEVISNPDKFLQVAKLNLIISQLNTKLIFLNNKYQTEKKLFYNLGFLFGLLIIIIFI